MKNRLFALLTAAALSLGGMSIGSSPATAGYYDPAYPTAIPNGPGGVLPSGTAAFKGFRDVEPGTVVRTVITSCRGVEHESTQRLDTPGSKSPEGYSLLLVFKDRKAGPALKMYFTISAPGKLDNVDPIPVEYINEQSPASCSDSIGGSGQGKTVTSAHVKKWSAKKKGHTKAKIGKTAQVTKTYLKPAGKGMKVTYRWTAGSKVIDKDRSVKVSKKYKGKKLKLKVTVSKAGYKARSKTLNFGAIKK